MTIKHVGVVGCGAMGSGIVQVILQGGYDVIVQESTGQFLEQGLARVEKGVAKLSVKGSISEEDSRNMLARLSGTLNTADLKDCDLIIEAVFEEIEIKKELFNTLDGICKPETIFASNTSSLSITEMSAATQRKGRVVGLHFFNPVPLMPLVEVVKTLSTEPDVIQGALSFAKSIGKVPVLAKDQAGFIVNLLLTPFMLDAMHAAANGVASVGDIDKAMKLGCNHPMGPLMLADFIGLDVIYNACQVMFEEYSDSRYAPPPILRKMVLVGNRGLKSGRGFYDWSDPKKPVPWVADGQF
ncbi:3-hydroxybutyryl-CoA dehydrogenase [Desulfosarcina ovata subsp. sediminis]|uniref:3-hydroxybutyryl-CoA dehydrogenase n=1 Tax=Desulfosarcina ovata subsp. sediminis TaxID=885957 RepID=A0A5K7ZJ48_9BACT|nr:3-hydroxyacyl-CoA dehydrogenase family protein [Desulfosarcina ovata]BBO81026.1 3-hydroxybutyryl-CoA dehydrogenase [Desulfosarcina ovata subsp. sediminis]